MNFIQMVTTLVLVCSVWICSLSGIRMCKKIDDKAQAKKKETECCRFIAESFKNTCSGKGFTSLNEWQITCRAMWNLEYIGWSKANDFMIVPYENQNRILYYGTWIGDFGNGEIYSKGTINF